MAGKKERKERTPAEQELEELIGLGSVKKLVYELQAYVEIQKKRRQLSMASEPLVLHAIFYGQPGTGKTTVARILGRIYKEMGVLEQGHLVEVERADLVGEYIGHTAQKTREQLKKALGGILFIDEAYALARGGDKDFGKEVIDTLVKEMEDHRHELILILAGYPAEMEWFLQMNPGLKSRFPLHVQFPNYELDELMAIADFILAQKQYRISPSARQELKKRLQEEGRSEINFANARLVRNLLEKAIRLQAARIYQKEKLERDDLMLLDKQDFCG